MSNIVGFRRHLAETAPQIVAELETDRAKCVERLEELDRHLAWARGVAAAAGALPASLTTEAT